MPSKKKASTQVNAAKPQPLHDSLKSAPAPPQPHSKTNSIPAATTSVNGEHPATKQDSDSKTGDTTESAGEPAPTPAINRKKQKRREKEAAKRAAEQKSPNGIAHASPTENGRLPPIKQGRGPVKGYFTEEADYADPSQPPYADLGSPEEAFYSGDEDPNYGEEADAVPDSSWLNTSKRKKVKNTKNHLADSDLSRASTMLSRSHIPPLSNAAIRASHKLSSEQIWNTSTQAERENIKQFWLELGEEERRSLVKVEKEAVLRKMKEQQKHSCSCSVCGRKRTAIEEELEVLYDAYYEELEQFANHNTDLSSVPQMMAPPRPPFKRVAHPMAGSYPSRGRVHEIDEDEEDLDDDEEYDEEDEEAYSEDEEELDSHGLPPGPPDFFQFGNSLTVKDGILTVADDLLKNDGKHFIDMMEQLAERRMQREEEIRYPSSTLAHRGIHEGHNHPPIDDDDDYDDEEDDEEDDSQEEEDYEGDEMDSMTEEQRMEEGRRMFQIFAARMFEQRVLTAYREKVAEERQKKLLEELDEESRLDTQREAKKAKEAAKRKEKKRLQKLAKDEEKARKDAEKAAQEAAAREAEERKLEEQRRRKEEQRKKREAEKKAAEEERIRKETEKLRKQQEQRERQAELERKQREAKERERQKREDAKKKEREEREAKDKEAKERKTKEDREKKAKEEQARKDKEATVKVDREVKDRIGQPPTTKQQPVALPPGLHPPSRGSGIQSPHLQVATPIVPPKVPTPGRSRQSSQPGQHSHASSPRSQKASTEVSRSSASPATAAILQTPVAGHPVKTPGQPPVLHHPQPSAPRSPLNSHGRGQYPFNVNGLSGLGVNGPPMGSQGMGPNIMPPMPMYQGPPMNSQPRFMPNGMQYPPGFPRPFQPGQQMPFVPQPQSQAPPPPMVNAPAVSKAPVHSRQPSNDSGAQPAPIARPGPIARPSSTTPDKQKPQKPREAEVEQLTAQLGSKALLDDSDAPFLENPDSRMNLPPLGPPGSTRLSFASSFPEPKQESFGLGSPGWGSFNPAMNAVPGWAPPGPQRPGPGWSQPPFGANGPSIARSHLPRPVAVRIMLVQACRQLTQIPGASADGYHPVQAVLRQLEALKAPGEPPVSMDEMLGICDTEGNSQNGGGSFEVIIDKARGQVIKFVEDTAGQPRGSVGEIGSPVLGHSQHVQPSPFGGIGPNSFGPPGRSF
ncbi:hypothetical protein A1O3_03609 [Capronia epimyces CBS 606.96]|uniref:Stress response protein NST1 n=1 Tax=Capronia epimyces CBS 606.96 TaxID=1182542 RepID=W9YBL4_9EURO|nr:uncharacterized protein A1O3_03609 [Capronia epimyces CBS 606.96]EXJ86656.1 hypothetical protein A1O3_03609 [Capronia epimyces CBS 606.96]